MSLNGLEDAKIQEAFEGAVAEPGGWYESLIYPIVSNPRDIFAYNKILLCNPSPFYDIPIIFSTLSSMRR